MRQPTCISLAMALIRARRTRTNSSSPTREAWCPPKEFRNAREIVPPDGRDLPNLAPGSTCTDVAAQEGVRVRLHRGVSKRVWDSSLSPLVVITQAFGSWVSDAWKNIALTHLWRQEVLKLFKQTSSSANTLKWNPKCFYSLHIHFEGTDPLIFWLGDTKR